MSSIVKVEPVHGGPGAVGFDFEVDLGGKEERIDGFTGAGERQVDGPHVLVERPEVLESVV